MTTRSSPDVLRTHSASGRVHFRDHPLPPIGLLFELQTDAKHLLDQVRYINHSEALRFARVESLNMPQSIKSRREIPILFEAGLATAKREGKLRNYTAGQPHQS